MVAVKQLRYQYLWAIMNFEEISEKRKRSILTNALVVKLDPFVRLGVLLHLPCVN